jgi:hypothetical protein
MWVLMQRVEINIFSSRSQATECPHGRRCVKVLTPRRLQHRIEFYYRNSEDIILVFNGKKILHSACSQSGINPLINNNV